jgi:hypothetical protein
MHICDALIFMLIICAMNTKPVIIHIINLNTMPFKFSCLLSHCNSPSFYLLSPHSHSLTQFSLTHSINLNFFLPASFCPPNPLPYPYTLCPLFLVFSFLFSSACSLSPSMFFPLSHICLSSLVCSTLPYLPFLSSYTYLLNYLFSFALSFCHSVSPPQ